MELLISTHTRGEPLAHAYLFAGDRAAIVPELFSFLETHMRIPVKGNPDLWYQEFEVLGINESRLLREIQSAKAFGEAGRFFILSVADITVEAQNALLKTFEDAASGIHIFFVVERSDELLPTFRSRFIEVGLVRAGRDEVLSTIDAGMFLAAAPTKRLSLIAPMIKEKDKKAALALCNALEEEMAQRNDTTKRTRADILEGLFDAKRALRTRGGSMKMALEHFALTAPTVARR